MNMTPDALVTLAGIVLSLAFAYVPGLSDWFDTLDKKWKPIFMALVLLVCAAGKLAYDCQLNVACLKENWVNALWAFLYAMIANQTTFGVAVKQFKA